MVSDKDRKQDPGDNPLEDAPTETREGPAGPRLPGKIGQFHVKGVLAWGGMGVVYRAVQEQPRRTVALKLMRHGIASRSAMRRFQYESQVLARLRHPGIAQVFDAGTHDDGSGPVPYFAMEYVPSAKSITRYARDKSLGTRERLRLFLGVCDAVHHGHTKGIIHRDLKPDNILVDTQGDVKIIDFGVARGTDSDLAVTTLQTEVGQLIGTLQYMSPEQCEADPDAIDARSDVYSLGVVLYEMLTGQLPYTLGGEPVFRSTKVIREQSPTRPSAVDRALRGDIETILMQALEKEPERRYQSAADLAQDIRLYLEGEPIRARPPSAIYRVQLFARRHTTTLATAGALILIVAVAAALVIRSQQQAREAMERAEQAELSAASEKEGSGRSGRATDMIGKVADDFTLTTLSGETFGTADLASYKATVLNFVAADCPYCFKQIPLVERIRQEYEPRGVRFINVVLKLIKEFTAQEAADVFARFGSQIEVARDEGARVGRVFKVSGYPTLSIVDSGGEVKDVAVGARNDLMPYLRGQLDALVLGIPTPEEKLADAEKLHRQTLESNRQTLGEGHRDTLQAMEDLAATLMEKGEQGEAERLYREMWDIRRRFLGENDPQTLESMHRLAVLLTGMGRSAEAEALHRQELEARRRLLGESDPATRLSMAHLGRALLAQGKTEGAEPYVAELIALRRRTAQATDASPQTLNAYAWLLLTCEPADLRDPAAALEAAETAAELSGRHDAEILGTLALAQKMNGDPQAAIATQKEALALFPPADFMDKVPYEQQLAAFCREAGELDTLEDYYRDSVARTRAALPPGALAIGKSLETLGHFLLERRRHTEAESILREVLGIYHGALPEGAWLPAEVESALGEALAGQGRFDEAERLLTGAHARLQVDRRVPSGVLQAARQRVVRLYEAWGRPGDAARYRAMKPAGP